MVHLHWQQSPGAIAYAVFSTPSLDTPFAEEPDLVYETPSATEPVASLPRNATDAYVRPSSGTPRYYAVTSVIGLRRTLDHPVIKASAAPGGPLGEPITPAEKYGGGAGSDAICWHCLLKVLYAVANRTTDPIDSSTGNFWHTFTDLSVPGRGMALNLSRTYNSMACQDDGPFGFGWSFSYDMALTFPDVNHVVVNEGNGSQVPFTEQPSGSYAAAPRVASRLTHNADGTWTLVQHHRETFVFDKSGRLTHESDLNGYLTNLAYNEKGQLSTVTDPAGRQLTFKYSKGRIISATDPLKRVVRYAYDNAGNLTDVTDVAKGNTHFTYDSAHRLLTMRMPNQAPGVAGSMGAVITNTYDGQGRVVSQSDQLGRTTTFLRPENPSAKPAAPRRSPTPRAT